MGQIRRRLRIYGRVQGVYFRDSTRQQALPLGMKGWRRGPWVLVALALVGAGLLLGGPASGPAPTPSAPVSLEQAAQALGVELADASEPALNFTLEDIQGRPVHLEAYRGRVVLLNFWATWCVPCRVEMPSLERLYQTYQEQGLVVVAVAAGEGREKVAPFVQEYALSFPVLVDPNSKVTDDYRVWAIPTTFVIGARGEVVGRALGSRVWDGREARAFVAALLAREPISPLKP